jgi:hypothetical protein
MELRKYRELEEMPKLRVLKSPGNDKKPIKGFVTLIIATMILFIAIIVTNSMDEPEKEETLQDFVEESISAKPI